MKKTLALLVILLVSAFLVVYFVFPETLYKVVAGMELRAAGLTRHSIDVGSHTLYYLEGGEGETTLLVHGFSADKSNWVRFSKYLTPSYHVVAIDLPGFGESSRLASETYTTADQIKRLEAFAVALGLEKFHLAGNSMGGSISGRYAAEYPERVLTLGLFNTGSVPSADPSEMDRLIEGGVNPLLVDTPADFDRVIDFVFVTPPPIPGSIRKYLTEQAILHRGFNEKVFAEYKGEDYSLEPDLSTITAKTLILWGDTDRLLHVSSTKVLAAGLPDSRTIIMEACGHSPMIERPEEAAGHYLAFLK